MQLAHRRGEESAATGVPPWEAVVAAAAALSVDLGYRS